VIFADTSFWIAIRNRIDARHEKAKALLGKFESRSLVTTNQVRGETWTYLKKKAGHASAVEFLDSLEHSPRVRTVFVTEQLENASIRWLKAHDEREYSFVDATSFSVMKSMKITEALAFDGDFSAAGFVELRP